MRARAGSLDLTLPRSGAQQERLQTPRHEGEASILLFNND
jgi:hypothetical protein